MSRISAILACGLLGLAPWSVYADSWALPEIEKYTSESGEYSFTVEPLPLSSQLSYFEEKTKGTADVGSESKYPKGRLVSSSGEVLWERKLVNEVSPVSALVSSSGHFVITFDNWHSVGIGPGVVVIYGESGQVIRTLALEDVVGPEWASDLPRSVSSIWWSGNHTIESDEFLSLSVVAMGSNPHGDNAVFESIRVRLKDGAVVAQ